jgi:hypothetical protein
MKNFSFVQGSQSFNYLNKYFPNFVFLDVLLRLLMISYFLEQITTVGIFHYDAVFEKSDN